MVLVRPAEQKDIRSILEIEKLTYGRIGTAAMATEQMLHDRIDLCNQSGGEQWFWVAESRSEVIGAMVLMPTHLEPDACTSWEHATDSGRLRGTFDVAGMTIFGVSLATSQAAPRITSHLLIHRLLVLWCGSSRRHLMFCSRIPGYRKAHAKTNIAATDYWKYRDKDGPLDPMLRLFERMIGIQAYRFLPNGYAIDAASGGHCVLCLGRDVHYSLARNAKNIYRHITMDQAE